MLRRASRLAVPQWTVLVWDARRGPGVGANTPTASSKLAGPIKETTEVGKGDDPAAAVPSQKMDGAATHAPWRDKANGKDLPLRETLGHGIYPAICIYAESRPEDEGPPRQK